MSAERDRRTRLPIRLGEPHVAIADEVLPAGQDHLQPFIVPDDAKKIRIEFARCTSSAPMTWPDKAAELTWHLFQEELDTTHYHGNSVAEGGIMLEEDGSESAWSWDETALKPGKNRVVHVVFSTSAPMRTTVRVVAL